VTLASTVPPVDSRAYSSSLSSQSSIGDTPMPFSRALLPKVPLSCVVQPQKVLDEGAEMTFSEDGGKNSATGGTDTSNSYLLVLNLSFPVVAENDELTPCPPTPQSETSIDDQGSKIVGRLRSDAIEPQMTSRSIHI
jgi:hypothetical protein